MKKIFLDGKRQITPIEIYKVFCDQFDFGPYFGNNPDALFDFMVPVDDSDKPVIIVWQNSNVFKNKYPVEFEQLLSVFKKISEFEKFSKKSFDFEIL